jgi:hypothetical protein
LPPLPEIAAFELELADSENRWGSELLNKCTSDARGGIIACISTERAANLAKLQKNRSGANNESEYKEANLCEYVDKNKWCIYIHAYVHVCRS